MSRYTPIPAYDFFIRDAAQKDPDTLIKLRLVVGIAFACIGCLIAISTWLSIADVSDLDKMLGWKTCSFTFICFASVLAITKFADKNAHSMASQMMIGCSSCILLYGMYYTGGPIGSYTSNMLILPPVMAFFLLGSAGGWGWTSVILGIFGFMAGLELKGHSFPDRLSGDTKSIELFFFIYSMIVVASLAYIYERLYRYQLHARTKEQKRFEYLALHDPLTSLANRKLFNQTFDAALSRAQRENYSIALLMIDLDHFKPLNDLHGHHVGDELLKHVGDKLCKNIRGHDLAARLGGDEFAVILENVTHSDIAFIADKILKAINTSIQFDITGSVEVSCSIGIAISNPKLELEDMHIKLYQQADAALYKAKLKRNNWCFLNDGGDTEQEVHKGVQKRIRHNSEASNKAGAAAKAKRDHAKQLKENASADPKIETADV